QRALRQQRRARGPHQAVRLDGARAADGPGRCDRRPRLHRQHLESQPPDRGRGDHEDLVAPRRQPGRAEAEARAHPPADRFLRQRHRAMSTTIRLLATTAANFEPEFQRVLHWSAEQDHAIEERVAGILADVQQRGDAAVLEYTQRFDGLNAASVADLEITRDELQAALAAITPAQRTALEAAAARVRGYHQRQLEACGRSWSYRDDDGTL